MDIKISDIKLELSEASIDNLEGILNKYRNDDRAGVIKLVQKYEKELVKYASELERIENMKIYENKYNVEYI